MESVYQLADAFPKVGDALNEMALFLSPLLAEAYDETPRKVSWFYRVWASGYVAMKSMILKRRLEENFTVPQDLLEELAESENGEDRIRTCGTLTGSRI